jgi:hypothetical protein
MSNTTYCHLQDKAEAVAERSLVLWMINDILLEILTVMIETLPLFTLFFIRLKQNYFTLHLLRLPQEAETQIITVKNQTYSMEELSSIWVDVILEQFKHSCVSKQGSNKAFSITFQVLKYL